ncbi:aminoglycoside phosphotransferase family protein [Paenibacillus sp. KN14-4R]|uniref:aminoglycoside phosphotransferase family protein n=1 Tax=Paenibacillus sp. KN14-4R TaxID=3445773 RepID=UPI003FA136F7
MGHINDYQIIKEYIPFLQGDIEIDPIMKGYSDDRKYAVVKDNQKYLLRTFNLKEYDRKSLEYEALIKMQEYNVKCSRPIKLGSLPDHGIGYMVLTFIEGDDASEELPKLSSNDQFHIGLQSGKELHKIHQYVAPSHISSWYDRKVVKHKNYMEEYKKLGIRVNHDLEIMSFIDDNLQIMKNRPNLFQHDDFHVGNLIVEDNSLSGVIDFNRFDWGDPIHEFLKVGMFSSEVSIPFSVGQIKGYHHNQEPNEWFWKLYSLYLAMCVFSSIVWIRKVKPEETDIMISKLNRVLEDHNNFELIKPKWYFEG